jgi:hypothetical protein
MTMRITTEETIRQLNILKSESVDNVRDDAIDKALRGLKLKENIYEYVNNHLHNGGYPLSANEDFIKGAEYAYNLILNALDGFMLEPKGE